MSEKSNVISEAILKRIRSLLAMSRGNANENEAAIAAQKAQELLTQYNLSLSDVEKSEGGKVIEDGDLMTGSSNPWRRSLAAAIASLYFCDYYWGHVYAKTDTRKCGYVRGDRHNFIGLPHNVVVTKEMFVYMVDTVERLALEARKVWAKKNGRRIKVEGETITAHAYEHAFRHGCATRLTNRIWEKFNEQTAPPAGLLVKSNVPALYTKLSAEVSDYMQKNHTELVVKKPRGKHSSWEGVMDGNRAGDTISLDTQLGAETVAAITKG